MKIADKDEFEKQNVFGTGTPNTAYAKYFIGESYETTVSILAMSSPVLF